MLKERLVKMLAEKSGYDVATPHSAIRLQRDIELATGERLSVNTIKRITGVLDYDGQLRESTMDIIAQYLDFRSAKELEVHLANASSDFRLPSLGIDLTSLQTGTRVEIEWSPGRRIRLRHLSQGHYIVEDAFNSKIKSGDLLTLGVAGEGLPLIASEVERGGESLGPYTAAPDMGVTVVKIL